VIGRDILQQAVFGEPEITVDHLKQNFLIGLLQYLVDPDTGEPFPDDFFAHHVGHALNEFQRRTFVNIVPTLIQDEIHDYNMQDYVRYAFLKLNEAPIKRVVKIRIVYPTGVDVTEFPPEWARIQGPSTIQIVPTAGTLSQIILGRGGAYLPLIYEGGLGFLPHLFHIDYEVGFANNKFPAECEEAVLKMATIEVLTVASDLIYGPGVAGVGTGIDGYSQNMSLTMPLFKARIDKFTADLQDGPSGIGLLTRIRQTHHGIPMQVA